MVANLEAKPFTAQAYLERELVSETRSEFRAGEIVLMTGGTPAHNRISGTPHQKCREPRVGVLLRSPRCNFAVEKR